MNDRDALYHAVHDYPGGAVSLAPRMGLAPSTLQSMANPNVETHPWPYKRVKQLLHLTGDLRPLKALCTEFDGVFVPMPKPCGKPMDEIFRDLGRLAKEFGDVPREVMADLKDGRISQKEFRRIEREIVELQQVAAELLQHCRTMVWQPPGK